MGVIRITLFQVASRKWRFVVSFAVIFLAILVVRLLVALMPGLFSSVLPIHVVIQVLKGVAIVYVILVMRDSITGILEATLMRLPVSPRSVAVARLVPSFIFIFLMTLLLSLIPL